MKTYKILSILLVVAMFFSNNFAVYAVEEKSSPDFLETEKIFEDGIKEIEEYLEMQGTNVCDGLDQAIEMLEMEKETSTDAVEIEKIQALIDVTEELKGDYISYSNGIAPLGVEDPVYSPMVAAVASFFFITKYFLSNELMIHAKDNDQLDSTYVPMYGHRIKYSGVIGKIMVADIDSSGSAAFENSENAMEKDLYYAIHNFNYTFKKIGHTFTLTDRYDYALSDEYTGVAGVAVDQMFLAQQMHVLVPYYVQITIP